LIFQISSETSEAEKTANDSLQEIETLKRRLEELQKKNLQNERRRDQAKNESESALRNATVVQTDAARYYKCKTIYESFPYMFVHFLCIIPG